MELELSDTVRFEQGEEITPFLSYMYFQSGFQSVCCPIFYEK